jgi:hypothetical protein
MEINPSGFYDSTLIISVALLNYFFFSMWKMLYGSYRIRPTWKWGTDFKRLKLLASAADSEEVRKKCKFILIGLYLSGGLFLLGVFISFI